MIAIVVLIRLKLKKKKPLYKINVKESNIELKYI